MRAQQQGFSSLVEDAYSGKLRLPEFQRDWNWKRIDVLRLFDSVRKDYPIGGFLTLEASDKLNLSPRLFEGVEGSDKGDIEAYVLDGQQRITAGLALYKGTGKSNYFLNLQELWRLADVAGLDYDDKECLREFADDLGQEDKYIAGRNRLADPEGLLDQGLLWTPNLTDEFKFSIAKERYLRLNPDRAKFMERLIWPFFRIGSEPIVPVTVLDSDMPVEAITRVFETLNTSGQRLTPVEIVIAVMFAQGIHLRQELSEFREITNYYQHMEKEAGEIFLQVIALLDEKNSKRATLPKTITSVNYIKFRNNAVDCLERAGEFLSERFGAGLDVNDALVPYPSMLPPLGIALAEIEQTYTKPGPEKAHWQEKLERWYVGSVLEERYRESQPATQMSDKDELLAWIRKGDEFMPSWLTEVRIGSLGRIKPSSAIGKLMTCMISREDPKDPLNKESVGGNRGAIASAQSHHIFPKAFCEQHIPDWSGGESNLALNVMPLTKETNRRWNKMDPLNQIADVRNVWPSEVSQLYKPFFINEYCLAIMEKPQKTTADYGDFINERGRLVQEYIAEKWGFIPVAEQIEDEEED